MPNRHSVERFSGYIRGTGHGLWMLNLIVQRLFRVDAACRYQKHFTSRVMHGSGLQIEDVCPKVRSSLGVSGGWYINAAGGLWIGKGTIWAPNVAIVSQGHGRDNLDEAPRSSGIRIGRDCW